MPEINFTDLVMLIGVIALFIPLMTAILQYKQSIQQQLDKNFRSIVENLSAKKKEDRIAAASSIGTFIKKDDKFYNVSIDVLINTISIERDHNVLNAIRGSLEKIDKKDYKYVIEKLLAIDRNFFVYAYPIEVWTKITKDNIKKNEEEYCKLETSCKEAESNLNRIKLTNLEKDIFNKQKIFSKFEKDLGELKFNEELVTNFISSFLKTIDSPITKLKLYKNSMNRIALTDLTLSQSKIHKSAFSESLIENTEFNDVTIINSIFTYSSIAKSSFINCKIESSLFNHVIFEDVDFSGSEFTDVFFTCADLTGADFRDTRRLKEIYFFKAKNINKAKFDNEFKKKLAENLNITEDKFKEYVINRSGLNKSHRDVLFNTLEELKNDESSINQENNAKSLQLWQMEN